ncbi:PREDICTED: ubiquitin carboxyl-terminal hydrolase 13-like [Ipomoea nil]|uniref:ubiquitin carboxyl-terminal hydrolase 13-like n=1 Tax=Ipomoea nil TaxID=35883 RepID=UPI0009008F1B|nr:PREDICTED: ubiquitin carboxyl-terminal hydrolase 13-like [Ipomoea nil]
MATFVREDGVSLSTTDVAPSHFIFKIQSVSLLTEYNVNKCTSAQFEAGGYKWKLIFYPNGNKRNDVTDHISMHLAMADTRGFQPGWEIYAVFRLFLLHPNNDTYLLIRDVQEKGRRFRETRTEWGFDRVIPVGTFNDPSYGYVVDDVCVFGAEVYVHKELRFYKGECLSMIKTLILLSIFGQSSIFLFPRSPTTIPPYSNNGRCGYIQTGRTARAPTCPCLYI